MTKMQAKQIVADLLAAAGITLNGSAPHDVQVTNDDFYKRVLQEGTLGLGEAYMDDWWHCPNQCNF